MSLTTKQAESLSFIKTHIKEIGYPPSLEEIAFAAGVTLTAAAARVNILLRKGAITRGANQARSIRPIKGFKSGV